MEIINKYFNDFTATQRVQFESLKELYALWNSQINVISRKDIDQLYPKHVLHSLAIAAIADFAEGTRVIDIGTGGGFPLVPLAILFPHCTFHGIDGIGKKITAVKGVVEGLGITNCSAEQVRSEDHKLKYDVIVSRAVTTLPEFLRMTRHLVIKGEGTLFYLKGGELADELLPIKQSYRVFELSEFFEEEFFATKKVVRVEL